MEIINPYLNWRSDPNSNPLNLNNVDGIACHHMAHPTWNIYEVHNAHLLRDNGTWKGLGYNFWIGFDGIIYLGRGFNLGAGIADHNSHVISIGFQGDYENYNTNMPEAQLKAGLWLVFEYLIPKLPNLRNINGHKFWQANQCPGKYFPLDKFIWEYGKEIPYTKKEDDYMDGNAIKKELGITEADWKKIAIKKALENGLISSEHSDTEVCDFGTVCVLLNNLYEKLNK